MNWDIADKTVLITGGSSGISYSSARALSRLGARVLITSRSRQAAEEAADALSVTSGNVVTGFELNLASIKSVREFSTMLSKEIEG